MRAMGPGSVSSLLKTALDVVYYLSLILAAGSLVAAAVVLILSVDLGYVPVAGGREIRPSPSQAAELLALFSLYVAVVVVVLGRVRAVFATLTLGDPFHPANVNRLRWIGVGLAALEALLFIGRMLLNTQIPGAVRGWPIDVTAWFSVLVVFVLAEVFREGARLRREAELTI